MTPARRAALQWFYDRGDVRSLRGAPLTGELRLRMERDGQVQRRNPRAPIWSLTDAGRRALNGDKT